MYDKLLKDLGIKEEEIKQDSPSRVLRHLLQSYIDSSVDSEEIKQMIIDYARKNNLVFLCPREWVSEVSSSALVKAEEIDHEKYLFTIKTEGKTAEFIRALIQALKDVRTSESDLVVSLASAGEDLPEKIILSEESFKEVFDPQEDYLKQDVFEEKPEENKKDKEEENLEKADELEELHIQVIADDQSIETLLEALNKGSLVILDPDRVNSTLSVEGLFVDSYKISEPDTKGVKTVYIQGSKLQYLSDIFEKLGELGNEGLSFPILIDGEYLMDWEGDITDYVLSSELKKAVNPLGFQPVEQGLDREQAQLQEKLASLGVTIESKFIKGYQIYNVYVDNSADFSLIDRVFEENVLKRIGTQLTPFYTVLTYSFYDEPSVIEDHLIDELSFLFKAQKGSPEYDEWLEKYRQKRPAKEKIMSKEDIEKVLNSRSVKDMLKQWDFQAKRLENEEKLQRMFKKR